MFHHCSSKAASLMMVACPYDSSSAGACIEFLFAMARIYEINIYTGLKGDIYYHVCRTHDDSA